MYVQYGQNVFESRVILSLFLPVTVLPSGDAVRTLRSLDAEPR